METADDIERQVSVLSRLLATLIAEGEPPDSILLQATCSVLAERERTLALLRLEAG